MRVPLNPWPFPEDDTRIDGLLREAAEKEELSLMQDIYVPVAVLMVLGALVGYSLLGTLGGIAGAVGGAFLGFRVR